MIQIELVRTLIMENADTVRGAHDNVVSCRQETLFSIFLIK